MCVKDKKAVEKLAFKVGKNISSKGCKFKVIWGIDIVENNSKKKKASKNGKLPFYAFALQPGKAIPAKFKQVSATSEDGKDPKIAKSWGKRSVCIPDSKEALLICGESWSPILMEKVKCFTESFDCHCTSKCKFTEKFPRMGQNELAS